MEIHRNRKDGEYIHHNFIQDYIKKLYFISGRSLKVAKQKIKGGTGIIAGGDVTISDIRGHVVIGKNITLSPSDKNELNESLIKFKKEIAKLDLQADTLSTVNDVLTVAIKETEKEKPDTSKIKNRFECALKTITELGGTIETVSQWKLTGKILKILVKLGL